MIHAIVGAGLRFRFLVVVVAAALSSFGISQLHSMPADVLPELSPPYVEIQTEALGLSAEEVEQMITVPMEQDLLAGVAWLDVIRSESVPGLSSVVVYFAPGTDLYQARQMVSERLSQAAVGLPHVSKPPMMIQPLSSASRFIIVGLSSQERSLIEMSVLARWVISPRMLAVPGVSNVAIWGQRDRQLQVQVDPEHLRAQGVTLQEVVNTTGNALWVSSLTYLEASSPGTGGFIDTPNQRLGVWHVLPISSPAELAQVPLETSPRLTLGDVAHVVEDHQPLIGDALTNEGPSLLLVIEKLPGANTLEVTRGVEEAVAALQPGMQGIRFDTTLYRPAAYIEAALANLGRILLVAAALVAVALLGLLWDWRATLVSLVAIPLSLLTAVVMLHLRGATLNMMVLAGLVVALAAVVDDGIIDVENIARRARGSPRGEQPLAEVLRASVEMRSPMMFATLILLLAVLPLFFLDGTAAALFRPLAVSYLLAVIASLVVALIVTPALCLILFQGAPVRQNPPLLATLQRGTDWLLARTIRRGGLALWTAAVTAVLVAGAVALLLFRQDLLPGRLSQAAPLPAFQESYVTVEWEGASGTSRLEMERIVARASAELRAITGVRTVAAHVGRAVNGDQVVGINSAVLWLGLDPTADYGATVAAIQDVVDGYAGLDRTVSTYLQQVLDEAGAGATGDLFVRVYGEDLAVLRAEAEKVRQALSGVAGIIDPHVVQPVEEPTLEIEVNLASAQSHGIKPGDVRRAAAILLSGLQVGSLFEKQKVFDVVVWSAPRLRRNLTDVVDLLIDTPGGGHVRLGDVAAVRIAPAPAVIRREAASPYLDVSFTVQGRSSRAVASDAAAALAEIPFVLEYHAEVVGEYDSKQAADRRVLLAIAIAGLGAFLLLQAALESWRLAALTVLALLSALSGAALAAVVAAAAHGRGDSSLGALLGLLATAGLALRTLVALISHLQRLGAYEGEAFGSGLALAGSRARAAPILTSALAAGLALLPFALAGNIPGNEIVRTTALVALAGLPTTMLVSLFVLPALYVRSGAGRVSPAQPVPVTVPGTLG